MCSKKLSHKNVITLNICAFAERIVNLKDAAVRVFDLEMIYQIEQENFLNNAVYHAACLTIYLAYRLKFTVKSAYP